MIFLPMLIFWLRRPARARGHVHWSLTIPLGIATLILLPYGFTSEVASPAGSQKTKSPSGATSSEGLREGTRVIGLSGTFTENGRRWMIHSDNEGPALRLLENLTLQRVARAIAEDPQDNYWKVSGILTEFENENFLLLDRIQRGLKKQRQVADL